MKKKGWKIKSIFRNNTNFYCRIFLAILFVSAIISCKRNLLFNSEEKPIAEAGGKFLYEEDVKFLFSKEISKEDSLTAIENYIKSWATDILLYEKAQNNIKNEDEIESLLESYRQSLIIYEYQLQLMKDRLKNNYISEKESFSYYENNPELFHLNEILIKGFFLIVPNQAPDKDALRALVQKPQEEEFDLIESLSIKNAAKFEYFNERWLPFSEIQKKSPIQIENKDVLKHRSFFESKDSLSTFWLFVQEYKLNGELQPFEYAEDKIKIILSEQKKNNFLKQFSNELYEEGIKNGSVKRY